MKRLKFPRIVAFGSGQRSKCTVLPVLFLFIVPAFAQTRIGSTGCRPDSSLLDPAYPYMKEWALAGVEGGIPNSNNQRPKVTVRPGDAIQPALDRAAKQGGGVVLLRKGKYVIDKTLRLPASVILRGEDREGVVLNVTMHGYHYKTGRPRVAAILVRGAQRVGIENLTLLYKGANFEPLDRDSMHQAWTKAIFHERERRDTTLFVDLIWIDSSRNCWVQDCNLLWAGNDPMRIVNSAHITCRGNRVDRSYNKTDGGMGYYNIHNSHYVLIYGEQIRRIRHFAIQHDSKYNVVYGNYLEVDINFHNDDGGFNLIEKNTIRIPEWHSWHCFQRGSPKQHKPPGSSNIVYNNDALYKNGKHEGSEKGRIYVINDQFEGKTLLEPGWQEPKGQTFYINLLCERTQ